MGDFNVTGEGFILALEIATVVVFLVSVLLLPRLWRPGILKYILQAVAMLLTAALLLLTVAAIENRENNWYTSWDEVFASDPSAQDAQADSYGGPAKPAAAKEAHQQATALQKDPAKNPAFGATVNKKAAGGQWVSFTVPGKKSGQTYNAMAWLPASYLKNPDRFYPVIMAFTGYPGSPQTYTKSAQYGQIVQSAVDHGRMRDSIVVIPDVFPGNYDSECVDGTQGGKGRTPKVETYVTQDFMPWVSKNFRTINDREAWATEGFSAGGWCAAMFPIRHPDLFGSGMIQSGYFSLDYTRGQQWTPQKDPAYDLGRIAREKKPDVRLHYFTSLDDTLSWPSIQKFRTQVQSPTSLTTETIPVGGHRLAVWLPGMELGLNWLGKDSPYFAPLKS